MSGPNAYLVAAAVIAYHEAIASCSDDNDALTTYRNAAGESLDVLYQRMLDLARAVVDSS